MVCFQSNVLMPLAYIGFINFVGNATIFIALDSVGLTLLLSRLFRNQGISKIAACKLCARHMEDLNFVISQRHQNSASWLQMKYPTSHVTYWLAVALKQSVNPRNTRQCAYQTRLCGIGKLCSASICQTVLSESWPVKNLPPPVKLGFCWKTQGLWTT